MIYHEENSRYEEIVWVCVVNICFGTCANVYVSV